MADPNRELFESVVQLLRPVIDELVFVGGCTAGLLITDPAASGIRPTKDVGRHRRCHVACEAQTLTIADATIRVVTPVYFLASKLEAFHGRGGNDITLSHDLEDIIAVIDGRAEIVKEVAEADPPIGIRERAEFRECDQASIWLGSRRSTEPTICRFAGRFAVARSHGLDLEVQCLQQLAGRGVMC